MASSSAADEDSIHTGSRVEVLSAFDDSWSSGFVVVERTPDGYRLRRRGDRTPLDTIFPADQVRREPKRSMWWV